MFVTEQKKTYWKYQYQLGRDYLIPLLQDWGVDVAGKKILDIGCAEAGILCALSDAGASSTGLEISPPRLDFARQLAKPEQLKNIQFVAADFLFPPLKKKQINFDLIMLRDVIEHLPDKQKVFAKLQSLMGNGSKLFITFPPFYSPFGGHQQLLTSAFRLLPYFHILPTPVWVLFRSLIKRFDKNTGYIKEIEKIRKHRISISHFLKSCELNGLKIVAHRFYLSRPSHRLRYGFPVILTNRIGRIPVLREVLITGAFFLLEKSE